MNEFALMHRGRIVNVVTTVLTKSAVQRSHPTYTVTELSAVPLSVLEQYRYWSERP